MRIYTVPFAAVAVTAQQDFFEVVAGSAKSAFLIRLDLSQHTEFGDAQDELLHLLIKRGQTTTGSGGSTVTPGPMSFGDAAFSGTTKVNNTTKATSGTIGTLFATAWNVRAGLPLVWVPEERIYIDGGQRLTVELASTPADSITLNGTLTIGEL